MSWEATNWATQLRVGSPIDKLCLLMLGNRADQDGVCWPSQARLADEGEMSADTVQRSLKRLEEAGFIRRSRSLKTRGRKGYVYQLMMPHVVGEKAAQSGLPKIAEQKQAQNAAVSGVPSKQSRPHKPASLPRTERPKYPAQSGLESSLESSIEPSMKIPVKGSAEAQGREKLAQHACPIPDVVASCLRRKLGNDRYAAWFSDVVVIANDCGKVTLSAGTKFRSDRINSNYDVDLVQAWQTLDPEIRRVTAIAGLPRPQDERTAASSI